MASRREILAAMSAFMLSGAAQAATPAKPQKPAKAPPAKKKPRPEPRLVITINKVSQKMTVALDGDTLYRWKVSTGAKGYETPSGNFRPFRLEKDHFSKEWDDAPMPHSIFFTHQGHAIHGSNSRLGVPLSHGCVRLAPQNAATLFKLVQREGLLKTRVIILDRAPVVTATAKPQAVSTGSGKKKSKKFVSPFYMDRWQR